MLCTDGILEDMEDEVIQHIFSDEIPDAKDKRDKIVELTQNNKDNHTAIIVHITEVVGSVATSESNENDCSVNILAKQDEAASENNPNKDSLSYKDIKKYSTIAALIAVIALVGFIIKTVIKAITE
jgi:hypothetical protein